MISSYPSIYSIGHKLINNLFLGKVVIEEKVDGSQFSFSLRPDGTLIFRSKGQEVHPGDAGMFSKAVEAVTARKGLLQLGWTYRAEYLQKPKHNCLAYGRVPVGHLVIFDIMIDEGENYLCPENKRREAERLGLECVPLIYCGDGFSVTPMALAEHFQRDSFLGGVKIEGAVIKNYDQFGPDKKILIGKFVSPAFKEKHAQNWKTVNPTKGDAEQTLVVELRCEARWRKAVQHLREAGKISDTPADIGPILVEIKEDVLREEGEHIKEKLFKHSWPQIARGITAGFPEWYKNEIGIISYGGNNETKTGPAPTDGASGNCDGTRNACGSGTELPPSEPTHATSVG